MKNIKIEDVVIVFIVGISGVLSFLGLKETYDLSIGISEDIIFGVLIAGYSSIISYFWRLLFTRTLKEGFFKKLGAITLIFLLMIGIFCTSTVFNIIFLSGNYAVRNEIKYKTGQLKTFVTMAVDERDKNLERISSVLSYIIDSAQKGTDREFQDFGSNTKIDKGPLWLAYDDVLRKATSVKINYTELTYNFNKSIKKDIAQEIDSYLSAISTSELFKDRAKHYESVIKNLSRIFTNFGREVEKLSSNKSDVTSSVASYLFGDQKKNSSSLPEKKETSPNLTLEQEQQRLLKKLESESDLIMEETDSYSDKLTIVYTKRIPSISELKDSYSNLLNNITKTTIIDVYGQIQIAGINDLSGTVKEQIKKLPLIHKNSKKDSLKQRRDEQLQPFLENTERQLEDLKSHIESEREKLKDKNIDVESFSDFFDVFGLDSIFKTIFDMKFGSIPMIGIGITIDFLLLILYFIRKLSSEETSAAIPVSLKQA
jgi:hypothetical protein